MTDPTNIAGLISSLSGGADLSSLLTKALSGGDVASKLSDTLGDASLGEKLAETLKNTDLSAVISALGGSGAPGGGGQDDSAPNPDSAGPAGNGDDGTAAASAKPEGSQPDPAQTVAALPSILGSLGGADKARSSERRALLKALRPFVGERRQRAIDMLLGFEKLTAFLPGGK